MWDLAAAQKGTWPYLPYRSGGQNYFPILCLDWPSSDWQLSEAEIADLLAAAPRFGLVQLDFPICSMWSAEPDPPPALTAAGTGPILVIGGTNDLGTPLETSRQLAEQLEQGVLLISEGPWQHLSYWPHPDTRCVIDTVDRYLTNLQPPANESRCIHGDSQLHPPAGG